MSGREKGRNDRNNRKEQWIGRQLVRRVLADDRKNNERDAQHRSKAERQSEPGKARLRRKHLGDDIQQVAKTFREAAEPARHAGSFFGNSRCLEILQRSARCAQNILESLGRLALIGKIEVAVGTHHGHCKSDP